MNAAAVRQALEEGVAGMEQALAAGRRIAWLNLVALVALFQHSMLDVTGSFESRPRLSISPCRLATRCMTTPFPFCNHRSPALAVPRAKP